MSKPRRALRAAGRRTPRLAAIRRGRRSTASPHTPRRLAAPAPATPRRAIAPAPRPVPQVGRPMMALAGLTAALVATAGTVVAAPAFQRSTVAVPTHLAPVAVRTVDADPVAETLAGATGAAASVALAEAPVAARWADAQPVASAETLARFVSPAPYPIGGGFGMRFHPILHYWRMHNGVDMGGACGTPIVAMTDGVVTRAGWNGGYGYLVTVDHGKVDGKRLVTNYAHLSVIGVKVGQAVAKAQPVGEMGTTGLSTGCHLHFEVNSNGSYVDPGPYITGRPSPANPGEVPDLTPDKPLPVPPAPKVRPTPTPTPTPPPAPGTPTPEVTPTPSPTPTPVPKPTPSPTPTPSDPPSPAPEPSTAPTATPSA